MKTIGLLCMSAALALAVDQDPKKATDGKTGNTAATPDKREHPKDGVVGSPPARRNLHQNSVAPATGNLTPEQKAAAALPTVPKEAEEVGANLYRYTDAQGKHWMYRKTPFGVSKWEEKPEDGGQPQPVSPNAGVTMTDLGDSVQFQRLTPFGPQKWIRKKSELSDEEKASFATQEHARQAVLGTKPADAAKSPEQH